MHLIHRRDELRAEKILQNRIFESDNIEIHWNSQLKEVLGDEMGVNGMIVTEEQDDKKITLSGVFIAIGHSPNTGIFDGQLDMDNGYIIIKSGLSGSVTETSVKGVFAAGDVKDKVFRQAVTAAGMGCMAALEAEKFIAENY